MRRRCARLDAHLPHPHVTVTGGGEARLWTEWTCPGLDVAEERAIETLAREGFTVSVIEEGS